MDIGGDMSISKIKTLQGKITKKFDVYTSFQCNQGYNHKKFYINISCYDEIHSHRSYKGFKEAVTDLERFLAMTENQFRYESAIDKAKAELERKKEDFNNACEDIAQLETVIRTIELQERNIHEPVEQR